ncbi:ArpU family transcriptional regulator [Ligilactobacillus murinus]|uniref:ArpU family transcriptional regulator n=1 Tax=Ligilactobacillus murinus TaxID=1622 RepID=UPI001CDD72E9|nr:ArpU family transcriptional regulator [Ligilactobacillus murinus]
MANIPEISSVRMSLAPKSTVHANGIEDLTVTRANAKQVLEFVEAVINSLGDYKPFLEARYIKKLQAWQIEERLGFGHSQTQTRIRKDCALFAQTMDMTAGTRLTAYKD